MLTVPRIEQLILRFVAETGFCEKREGGKD